MRGLVIDKRLFDIGQGIRGVCVVVALMALGVVAGACGAGGFTRECYQTTPSVSEWGSVPVAWSPIASERCRPAPEIEPDASGPTPGDAASARGAGPADTLAHDRQVALASAGDRVPAHASKSFGAHLSLRCLRGGRRIKSWSGPARWRGPLPARYRGVIKGGRIQWLDKGIDERAIRVATDFDGSGGRSILAWCGRYANAVEVLVVAGSAATGANPAGGQGGEKRLTTSDLGDKAARDKKARKRTRAQESGARDSDAGQRAGERAKDASADDDADAGEDEDVAVGCGDGMDEDADASADDDADASADDADDADAGADDGEGERPAGGRGAGQGKDANQASGATHAKKGGVTAAQGGVDGEFARLSGQKHGDEQGARGGEGEPGSDGVRGGGALFGGLVSVPAALRALVEVLLVMEDAIPAKLAATWIRKKIRDQTVKTLRRELRREALDYARKRMRKLAPKIEKSKGFVNLTRPDRRRFLQHMEWEIARTYVAKIEEGAEHQLKALKAALARSRSKAARTKVQAELARAKKLLKAARVQPLAGRLPANHAYAGEWLPGERIPRKYRSKGVRFTEDGYPDFRPYARKLPSGKKSVTIKLTGKREADFRIADRAAGFAPGERPSGYTWHHYQDGKTMILVPKDLHAPIRHTGGGAYYRHFAGDLKAYNNRTGKKLTTKRRKARR